MNVIPVSQFAVDAIFPRVAHFLAPAIAHNRCSHWTPEALYQECVAGRWILFVDDHAEPRNAMLGRFDVWQGERVFYVGFLGGEGGTDWQEAFNQLAAFARRFGVTRITAHARDGLLRHLQHRKLSTLVEIEDTAHGQG